MVPTRIYAWAPYLVLAERSCYSAASSSSETKPAESKPAESKQNPKPEGSKPTKAVAASTTKAKTTGVLAATGDTSGAAIVATVLAGTAAIAAGTMASRKRS